MTTGEGGMVTTHDMGLADSLKILCLHGISKNAWNRYSDRGNWYYEVLEPGFKYNLSDVHSAIGIHQLRKLEQFIELRTQYAEIYNRALADVEEFELPPDRTDSRHSWHLYMLRLNLNKLAINRDEFINMLREKGVGTSVHFIPIPLHPFFSELACLPQNQCPRAMALYPRTISMPLYPALTVEQVEYSAKSAKEIAHRFSKSKRVFVPAAAGLVSGAPMSGD
jgi:dTDP-4-amino-4,6-dideoxygalactose transaminase